MKRTKDFCRGPGPKSSGNMEKSHKAAVIIAPPAGICSQIQEIRQKHDKAYERWMPHINLLYPFYEDTGNVFEKERLRMFKNLCHMKAFEVAFIEESIGYFVHGSRMVVWLKPLFRPVNKNKEKLHFTSKSKKGVKKDADKLTKIKKDTTKPTKLETEHQMVAKKLQSEQKHGSQPSSKFLLKKKTGLDALRNAFWTPENTKEDLVLLKSASENQEPGISTLYFDFEEDILFEKSTQRVGTKLLTSDLLYDFDENATISHNRYNLYDFDENATISDTKDLGGIELKPFMMSSESSDISSSSSSSDSEQESDDFMKSEYYLPDRPDGEHPHVMRLQASLEELYPDLDDLSKKSPDGFKPHLTLGQFGVSQGHRFLDTLRKTWVPVRFICNELCLISRENALDPFSIRERIPLQAFKFDTTA